MFHWVLNTPAHSPIVQSNQIFRVSLTLIAKSKHINYEIHFWKTIFRMEYHPLLTIDPNLSSSDYLISWYVFLIYSKLHELWNKKIYFTLLFVRIHFCEHDQRQHLIQISRFTNFKFKRTKPFPHKMTIQMALQV